MTTRDELADLIHDALDASEATDADGAHISYGSAESAADAILARWRLVPVGNDVKFHADVTEDPLVMVDEHAHEWWSDFHGNVECVHCGQLMPNT